METCENETLLNYSESHKYTVDQMINIIKARITNGIRMYMHNFARLSAYASFWRKASTVAMKKNKSQLKLTQ